MRTHDRVAIARRARREQSESFAGHCCDTWECGTNLGQGSLTKGPSFV
jgi:hypothetical protein